MLSPVRDTQSRLVDWSWPIQYPAMWRPNIWPVTVLAITYLNLTLILSPKHYTLIFMLILLCSVYAVFSVIRKGVIAIFFVLAGQVPRRLFDRLSIK